MDTGWTAGVRVVRSKLAGESGSKASMLIVRQLTLAMARGVQAAGSVECRGGIGVGVVSGAGADGG